ncbi:hypothetical protein KDM41_15500 [bacterium]|nr:hypothetical protein [bacterium]
MTRRADGNGRIDGRFALLRGLMVGAGVLLALRVFQVQVLLHDDYLERARDQWGDEVATNAERGHLYDRHGKPLALSVTTWKVGLVPGRLRAEDVDRAYAALAEVLGTPARELRDKVRRRDGRHTPLAADVVLTESQRDRLWMASHGAVTLDPVHARIYPTDGVGASLIGRYRPDPEQNLNTGLERSLDGLLAGTPGRALKLNTGDLARERGQVVLREAVHGRSLVLSLDADLQDICERRLASAVADCGAAGGSVLIMDPATGDVLAAASWPLMDTREHSHPDGAVWNNRNFDHLFEPGSVLKVFTMASLLRNSAVDTQTVYNCDNGTGHRIYVRNDGGHDYGDLTLMQAFTRSSNVYFAKAVANLRPDEFYRDLTSFGFGQRTTAPYPSQQDGILRAPAEWSGRSLQTLSIGQEMSVTALQLGMALCSVGNDGVLFAPRLVREIRDDRGHLVEAVAPVALRRVMSPALAGLLREGMARVVREGTGEKARTDWVDIGGKTGTAQKARPGEGYVAYVASFGGLVPIQDPRLMVLVVLDEPRGIHHYAAQSAVPLFHDVLCDIRRSTDWLTDVPGGRTAPFAGADPQRLVAVPDVMYLGVGTASRRLAEKDLVLAGGERDGVVVQQVPAAGTRCAPGTVVTLTVADRDVAAATAPGVCPDFSGLSNRQIRSLAARLRIPVSLQGVGYAVRQSVRPGETWGSKGVTIELKGSRL